MIEPEEYERVLVLAGFKLLSEHSEGKWFAFEKYIKPNYLYFQVNSDGKKYFWIADFKDNFYDEYFIGLDEWLDLLDKESKKQLLYHLDLFV